MKFLLIIIASVFAALAMPVHAKNKAVADPNASKEPIQIDADQLEVRDKDKMAIFTGHVVAVQGKLRLETNQMKVFYEDNKTASAAPVIENAPAPAGGQSRKVKRIEAFGAVKIMQENQTGTGNSGVYDMQQGQMTLTGNVTLTQDGNVIQGDRLVTNTRTQESHVYSDGSKNSRRVRALVLPSAEKSVEKIQDAKPTKPAKQQVN